MAISRELMFEVLFKIFHDRVKPVRQRGEHDIEVFLQYALACFDDLLGSMRRAHVHGAPFGLSTKAG